MIRMSVAMWTSRLLRRLRNNFQLSIITLMGLFGVVGITPYAVYRLVTGNYLVGFADTFIVVSTMLAVLHAWRTGDTVKPGIFLAIVFSAGSTLIAINLGVNGLFWIYPLILFNFFMVSPGKALVATILVLISLVGYSQLTPGTVFESDYQMISFLVTGMMASALTFVFAYRTTSQRDQLQQLAILDPLTGARNRRSMNDELRIAASLHRRHGNTYGVLIMDLDHFKRINDNYGHQAGDQVLVDFVALIKRSSRKENRLFRFGGEEFVVLLRPGDADSAHAAFERFRQRVEAYEFPNVGRATASIGYVRMQPAVQRTTIFDRADEALYWA